MNDSFIIFVAAFVLLKSRFYFCLNVSYGCFICVCDWMQLRLKVVDKKQSEFSIKKMIKRLHIKEPAEHVMAILGKK